MVSRERPARYIVLFLCMYVCVCVSEERQRAAQLAWEFPRQSVQKKRRSDIAHANQLGN